MKTSYIFLAFIAILGYNALIIKRDAEMFKSYDHKQSEYCKTIGCENEKLH
jgi:hypothetical protein